MDTTSPNKKGIAFDINMKVPNANTSPSKVKDRLEKRSKTFGERTERLTMEDLEQKLERAREKRDQRLEALKNNTTKKYGNADDIKTKFEKECEVLRAQLEADQVKHEERRKEQLNKVQQKAVADLEKVKVIKSKMINKENVSANNI